MNDSNSERKGWAKNLSEWGFYVFPLRPNSKLPAIKKFKEKATRDFEQISNWFDGSDYNIGISTSNFKDERLIVVDIDSGKGGFESVMELELDGLEFPATYTQETPTGGQHLVYRTNKIKTQGANVLGRGIDIRADGGLIVGAGSMIDGKPYNVSRLMSIEPCPAWIEDRLKDKGEKKEASIDASNVDQFQAFNRAEKYLREDAPLAIEGQGGDTTTFKVAAKLKDFGLTKAQTLNMLATKWNDRCTPPWNLDDLSTKIESAYIYGQNEPGSNAAELQFDEVDQDKIGEGKHYLDAMNDRFSIVFQEGGHVIMEQTFTEKGEKKTKFMPESSFKRLLSTQLVAQENKKPISRAEVWLDWKDRKEYYGLCFKPEQKAKFGYFNTWNGFAVRPQPRLSSTGDAIKGYDMFMSHVRDNICDSNSESFTWLMTYFAHLIQKPYEKPLTSVVFKGKKGVGKNAFIDRVGKILGHGHYRVAHDSRYLTSNFNGHFENCLCLVLDEAFWSGDKSAEGKLKGLITSPEIMIEKKGKEPYTIDNFVRVIIIGNESWLVPASEDERRYTVFNVGSGRQKDANFFHTMRVNMDEKGGNKILFDELKKFDLGAADINQPLENEALAEQKIESMSSVASYVYESLKEGRPRHSAIDHWGEGRFAKDDFISWHHHNMKQQNAKGWRMNTTAFTKKLKDIFPEMNEKVKTLDNSRRPAYSFGDLDFCRNRFSQWLGSELNWD